MKMSLWKLYIVDGDVRKNTRHWAIRHMAQSVDIYDLGCR